MTDKSTQTRKATHRVYSVSGEGKSAYWQLLGHAVPNSDGLGFNLLCNAMPIGNARMVMREIQPKDDPAQGRFA